MIEQYQNIKSQILLIDPLPTINKVLSIVLQEERQQGHGASGRADVKDPEAEVLANIVESNGKNQSFSRGRGFNKTEISRGRFFKEKVCTYCSKNGHIVDVCYRKHGYPPNWVTCRGNASTNSVGIDAQETNIDMKMKGICPSLKRNTMGC